MCYTGVGPFAPCQHHHVWAFQAKSFTWVKAYAITEAVGVELDTMATVDEKRAEHQVLVTRILEGDGSASRAERHSAFDDAGLAPPMRTLIDKVAKQPTHVTNEDIANVKASGLSEDQIFELVICAAVGEATRQYDTALEALAEAVTDTPEE
jgi:hypothetical protein